MSIPEEHSVGRRLRRERERLNWTQERLAEEIKSTSASINRWENDKTLPQPHYREQLCRVFQKSAEELFGTAPIHQQDEENVGAQFIVPGNVPPSRNVLLPRDVPPPWNVPHLRNLYFTGRESTLIYLHETLNARGTGSLIHNTAISGLGGVGKTQCAVEYIYRYGSEYRAVLWVQADSQKSLVSDFVKLAGLLNLPEKDEADHTQVPIAVKLWLQTHSHWLLILDNADDLEMVYEFLPMLGEGHILLTTRSQATGPSIKGIELEKMGREEGILFLLRRAKLIDEAATLEDASLNDRREAEAISQLLDGLPLALDQAAAYIEENRCSLSDYLNLYRLRGAALLKRRGAFGKRDYPNSVATTWSLSFERIQQSGTPAPDLLRLCTFLHPDAIPEAMLMAGSAELTPLLQPIGEDPLLLNDAISELRKYSLIRRNPETKTLTIHRLMQTILKDIMDKETQLAWAERAVRMTERAFPNPKVAETWPLCQLYLPHAQTCSELVECWEMIFPAAARLLRSTGVYLYERGQYPEAEQLLLRTLAMRERTLEGNHADLAESLTDLGILCYIQSKFDQAELLLQRALSISEQAPDLNQARRAESLTGLAWVYKTQGKFELAEPLLQRALAIHEQQVDLNPVDVAESLNELGVLYSDQGKFELAEQFYRRALTILERVLDPQHPFIAGSLNNLAVYYRKQGKFDQAEPLFQQALTLLEQVKGPDHPDVATSLNNLARMYFNQGELEQAEPLFQRALAIREHAFGPAHPKVATSLHGLAKLSRAQGNYSEAERLYQRALAIRQQSLGPRHPEVSITLQDYASLLRDMGRGDEAIQMEEQARGITGE
jgi:tetratricopeptide (TPR) repeat protein/transcriptional regulator with XRE-family HTH domain